MRALRHIYFSNLNLYIVNLVEIVPSYEGIATISDNPHRSYLLLIVEIVPSYEGIAT